MSYLQRIIEKIMQLRYDFYIHADACPNEEPKFVIYVDNNIYHEICKECQDPYSVCGEYRIHNTILGNPIYRVLNSDHGWKVFQL